LTAVLGVPLHVRRLAGHGFLTVVVNTGMGVPPVVVGLVVTILLWRTGPLGSLALLYTPAAMVLAQVLAAVAAGFGRASAEVVRR
jgi:tungstate transport system permease protein